jgi:hypothetical protein
MIGEENWEKMDEKIWEKLGWKYPSLVKLPSNKPIFVVYSSIIEL